MFSSPVRTFALASAFLAFPSLAQDGVGSFEALSGVSSPKPESAATPAPTPQPVATPEPATSSNEAPAPVPTAPTPEALPAAAPEVAAPPTTAATREEGIAPTERTPETPPAAQQPQKNGPENERWWEDDSSPTRPAIREPAPASAEAAAAQPKSEPHRTLAKRPSETVMEFRARLRELQKARENGTEDEFWAGNGDDPTPPKTFRYEDRTAEENLQSFQIDGFVPSDGRSLRVPEWDPPPVNSDAPDPADYVKRRKGESAREYGLRKVEVRRGAVSQTESSFMRPIVMIPGGLALATGVVTSVFAVQALSVKAQLDARDVPNRHDLDVLVARGNQATTWALGFGVVSAATLSFSIYQLVKGPSSHASLVLAPTRGGISVAGVLP